MTRAELLEKMNFNKDGVTIAYVGGDSYARRAELKADGWSYDKIIGWHKATVDEIADNMKEVLFEQIFQWDGNPKTGRCYKDTATSLMKKLRQPEVKNSKSEFQGEPGQRIRDRKVKVISKHQFNGAYGLSEVIKFMDTAGNVYVWFTSTFPDIEIDTETDIDFTVKKLDIYAGEKVTYITRTKLK